MVLLKTVMGPVTPEISNGCPPKKDAINAAINCQGPKFLSQQDSKLRRRIQSLQMQVILPGRHIDLLFPACDALGYSEHNLQLRQAVV